MTGPGREHQSDQERALLIKGARIVLRRSGFDGLKVNLVLRESGLSARTFYRQFADKSALVVALIEDEYASTARRLNGVVDGVGDNPEVQVSSWIRELLLGAVDPQRHPRTRLFTAHYSVMSAFPQAAARANELVIEPLASAIARGQEIGVFAGSDSRGDAMQLSHLVGGTLTQLLTLRPDPSGFEDIVQSTTEFALRALRAGSPVS